MEHGGESGVKLSAGAVMEINGDQAAAAINQFCCKTREEPSRKRCHHNTEWSNRQGQPEAT